MPLINCPECGRKISTQAKTCPECGYAISHPITSKTKSALALAILILIISLGLLITNPDKEEFISHIKIELGNKMNHSNGLTPAAKVMTATITSIYLNSAVSRVNYGIFSIFKIDLSIARILGKDTSDKAFIGIASNFFSLNMQAESTLKTDSINTIKNTNSLMNCNELINNADDSYLENYNTLVKYANLQNGWSRNTESFVYGLCKGDLDLVNQLVLAGKVQIDEAASIARVLGISYKPPDRDTRSMLLEITEKKLVEFMCTACAGNAALYFVDHPNSDIGKIIKKAMDGDQKARSILQEQSWSQ